MQKVRVPITNFQFGEISDSTIMRTDSPVYQASAQRVENLLVRAEGGVVKRAGLRNLHDFGLTRNTAKRMQLRLCLLYSQMMSVTSLLSRMPRQLALEL